MPFQRSSSINVKTFKGFDGKNSGAFLDSDRRGTEDSGRDLLRNTQGNGAKRSTVLFDIEQ